MTDKQLKKLSRADLLTLLIDQSKELEQVRARLEQAEEKLASREIKIAQTGSIAEAALQLNGLFEAAQAAGEQYLENLRVLSTRQETVCAEKERQCDETVAARLSATEKQCKEMVAKAKTESQAYWDEVSVKLEAFYREHAGLKELLAIRTTQQGRTQNET